MAFDLKKLKSLFIVEEEKKADQPVETTTSGKTSVSTGQLDQQIMNTLLQAFAENNVQGFDYFEFKQSLRSLTAMNLDESTAFKSAFATAATLGITKNKLLETASFYQTVLDKEKEKFDEAMKSQNKEAIHNKKDEVVALQEQVRKKSEEIKRLTSEITSHQQEMERINLLIEQAELKIGDTSANFNKSFSYLKSEIQVDIQKIQQYI